MSNQKHQPVSLFTALLPVLFLLCLIIYGLILRPHVFEQEKFPLEMVFIAASFFAASHLAYLGYSWKEIMDSAMGKLTKALPTIFILFAIGLVIGSWIVSGTIPMFVYYGIKIVNPQYIYVLAFLIPIMFSTFTGTSWGSVGTVGIVIIGVALTIEAHMPIVAGAIIGGAYFGDKISPLSDTTNMAALATDVDLYEHINSMMYTTLPSAIIAAIIYTVLGFVYPPQMMEGDFSSVQQTLNDISSLFNFNILLILPIIVVLIGSYKRTPTIPVLLIATLTAAILALIFQKYTLGDVVQSLSKGFDTKMVFWQEKVPESMTKLFNRGGLYSLSEPIIIALFVFVYIGMLDRIRAVPIIVERVFAFAKTRVSVILSSLFSSAFTNATTGNQYATSFIIGEAFKAKYDKLKINRKVLSRSIEDYGTMLESIIPWSPAAVYLVVLLGVPFGEYWYWQLLTLINLIIAPLIAILGIGCFYKKTSNEDDV